MSAFYYNIQLLEVNKHFYNKWYTKNGSHKLMVGVIELIKVQSGDC